MGVPVYHGDFYSDDFILNPTQGYADLRARGWIPELRDPCLFLDEGRLWLLYSGGGERGIGVAEVNGF